MQWVDRRTRLLIVRYFGGSGGFIGRRLFLRNRGMICGGILGRKKESVAI